MYKIPQSLSLLGGSSLGLHSSSDGRVDFLNESQLTLTLLKGTHDGISDEMPARRA